MSVVEETDFLRLMKIADHVRSFGRRGLVMQTQLQVAGINVIVSSSSSSSTDLCDVIQLAA